MSSPVRPADASAAAVKPVTRDDVARALSNLETAAQHCIDTDEVPGLAVAVVHADEVVYLKGAGVRRVGGQDRVDEETVFQLASLSKPIASTIVAAIVGERRVTWETRIADVDPGFRLFEAYPTRELTIRDLFAHRSGLSGNAGNDLEGVGFTRDDVIHRLRYLKPASSFRSTYAYSNFGLTEGALAAARSAGLEWEDAADNYLYRPLGLASTSSRYQDFLGRKNRASLHARFGGAWTALAQRNADAQSPAGGVSSTVRDLAQWMRLELANGRFEGTPVIEEDAIAPTKVPLMERGTHPVHGVPSFYGLGWNIEHHTNGVVWGHAGAFSQGARTVVSLVPSQQLGIIVLTNAFPTGVPEGLVDTFLADAAGVRTGQDWLAEWNRMYASIFGPAHDEAVRTYGRPPANPSPALPLAAYVGAYTNAYLGRVSVTDVDGSLVLGLGPEGARAFTLEHFDRDQFVYRPYDETPDLPVPATFTIGPDKAASHLTLEDLNDNLQGVLQRMEPDLAFGFPARRHRGDASDGSRGASPES